MSRTIKRHRQKVSGSTAFFTSMLPVAVASLAIFAATAVHAADAVVPVTPSEGSKGFVPFISGELLVELENDNVFSSNDPANEFNSLYPTVELAVIFGMTEWLSANLGVTLEQVLEQDSDNYFRDVGVFVDTLNLEFSFMDATVVAGKFAPTFGRAWDETPGLFSTELNEDYEITEMIGFGFAYPINAGNAGTHTLAANVFFVDTTVLSESAFTNRGRVRLADGGPANTEQLDNFSVTLDGADIAALPGLTYNLGFTYLSAGATEVADQQGYVFGLAHSSDLANGATLALLGEVAYFNNAGGTLDDATYLTAGVGIEQGPWHGEAAASFRMVDLADGGSEDTRLFQVSGGYVFDNEIDLSVGYAYADEAGTYTHKVGILLSKSFTFATPGAPEEEFDLEERPRVRTARPRIVQ